jgi:hyaluronan synthase
MARAPAEDAAADDGPVAPLGPNDVLDLTDTTGPRIVRGAPALPRRFRSWRSAAAACGVAVIVCAIGWHLLTRVLADTLGPVTLIYSVIVSSFVLSRFALAALYRPPRWTGYEPTVAIIVPAFNEGPGIGRTIDACIALDYPAALLEIVCIDDGSTDDTFEHLAAAVERNHDRNVQAIRFPVNRGKRAAVAAGIRATDAEILVFIDSDSQPEPEAVRWLVQGFADDQVAAVSGLTHVRNARENLLTKMQSVRYYISFQVLKSAESVVGAVTCCSGCFAGYRGVAVREVLEAWETQHFLGVQCTYGDDRSLTNMLLRRGWTSRYAGHAVAVTDAPETYPTFLRQQLRWKKSWARESPLLLAHLWRSRLRAFPFTLIAVLASLLSPFVIGLHIAMTAVADPRELAIYALGLYLVAMGYALVYRALREDGLWWYALPGTAFYLALSPMLLWAIAKLRDGSWGTRG